MNINTWDPNNDAKKNQHHDIDPDFLNTIIKYVNTEGLDNIEKWLPEEEQKQKQVLMQQNKDSWIKVSSSLSSNDITALIKFFTLAEMCYPQWEAGEKSPVIGLAKTLREKNGSLEKDLVKWIKANTRNKFLPYGPL